MTSRQALIHSIGIEKNEAEGVRWVQKSTDQGNAIGEYELGNQYKSGAILPQNNEKAFEWYQKSANQGLDLSEIKLASMYTEGSGVPEDLKEAAKWVEKAADQGNARGNSF